MLSTTMRSVMGVLAFGALLVTASPASAATNEDPSGSIPTPVVKRIPVDAGDVGTLDYSYTCFGSYGVFKSGTSILKVDWNGDGIYDECFGIAVNRSIWHEWPGSRRWHVMPHNGRADDTWWAGRNSAGQRTVAVLVNPNQIWCSSHASGSGWGRWYGCS